MGHVYDDGKELSAGSEDSTDSGSLQRHTILSLSVCFADEEDDLEEYSVSEYDDGGDGGDGDDDDYGGDGGDGDDGVRIS